MLAMICESVILECMFQRSCLCSADPEGLTCVEIDRVIAWGFGRNPTRNSRELYRLRKLFLKQLLSLAFTVARDTFRIFNLFIANFFLDLGYLGAICTFHVDNLGFAHQIQLLAALVGRIYQHLKTAFFTMAMSPTTWLCGDFSADNIGFRHLAQCCLDWLRCCLSVVLESFIQSILNHNILILPVRDSVGLCRG